jgi:starch synthase
MPAPLKILFITAEAEPFAKTGGLADVSGSLPKALHRLGHDVRIAMPAYQNIEAANQTGKWDMGAMPGFLSVPIRGGILPTGVFRTEIPGTSVPVHFIAERSLFDRPKIYGYDDDPYRFSFFARAALELISALHWKPDVIHAHDWHAAPALVWLANNGQADERYRGIASLFTIHNLTYQGRSSWDVLSYLGIQTHRLVEESYGEVNFMARGIYHSTLINTVSPTYAREILTPDKGASLDGLLRTRHYDLHGILNGLDTEIWNPTMDKNLVKPFRPSELENRIENKRALQVRLGLPQIDNVPILAMVSRLDKQKGLDIIGHTLHTVLNGSAGEVQVVVLGSGKKEYEDMFSHLASYHKTKMSVILTYAPELAPLIYGGSDIFLMPSLFEPCGLSQMIAMRYGCVPIVRETGGLADTVRDGITGFTFYDFKADDFLNAIHRALYIYNTDHDAWQVIQTQGMLNDFSWQQSAYGYQQLYEWAVARVRGF